LIVQGNVTEAITLVILYGVYHGIAALYDGGGDGDSQGNGGELLEVHVSIVLNAGSQKLVH
jgi:hypothetical protein